MNKSCINIKLHPHFLWIPILKRLNITKLNKDKYLVFQLRLIFNCPERVLKTSLVFIALVYLAGVQYFNTLV